MEVRYHCVLQIIEHLLSVSRNTFPSNVMCNVNIYLVLIARKKKQTLNDFIINIRSRGIEQNFVHCSRISKTHHADNMHGQRQP